MSSSDHPQAQLQAQIKLIGKLVWTKAVDFLSFVNVQAVAQKVKKINWKGKATPRLIGSIIGILFLICILSLSGVFGSGRSGSTSVLVPGSVQTPNSGNSSFLANSQGSESEPDPEEDSDDNDAADGGESDVVAEKNSPAQGARAVAADDDAGESKNVIKEETTDTDGDQDSDEKEAEKDTAADTAPASEVPEEASSRQELGDTRGKVEVEREAAVEESASTPSILSATSSSQETVDRATQCADKWIHIYPLPSAFHRSLLLQCSTLLPWYNMCPFFVNHGVGEAISFSNLLVPYNRWFETNQLSLEVIFHRKLKKSYPCLTDNPDQANLFFIPFYAALDSARYLYSSSATAKADRDHLPRKLVTWLQKQVPFQARSGRDHVMVISSSTWDFRRGENASWGTPLLLSPSLKEVTKLVLDRNVWDQSEVAIPHPNHFHPKSDKDLANWQKRVLWSKREKLVSYIAFPKVDNAHDEILRKQCGAKPRMCRLVQCLEDMCRRPTSVMGVFLSSTFCLLPPGDLGVRQAFFQALVAGCIPVIFEEYGTSKQFSWHLPEQVSKYAVLLPKDVFLKGDYKVLQHLKPLRSEAKVMRRFIVDEILPSIIYAYPSSKKVTFEDAFSVAIRKSLERARNAK